MAGCCRNKYMIKIHDRFYCPIFEYLYLFVIVIYMAQMTPETGRMVGFLSGNPIPFLIPIFLTVILLFRHPISFFNRNLWTLVGVLLSWSVAVCYKFHDFSNSNLSYYFFLIYAIIIAFIHIKVYGRKLFDIYEHIMVVFSVISLVLWGMYLLFPSLNTFFLQFPETSQGNNVLYIFNWMDPAKGQIYGSFIRNAGCSWEPGRFAIMLLPAILINLYREGIKFRNNKHIVILLLALASTFSTTGYSIAILLYSIFWLEKFSVKKLVTFFLILIPTAIYLFSLDFMGEKIEDRYNFSSLTKDRIEYHKQHRGDEYVVSLDRFESMTLEWVNFQKDPILGYGRNTDHSWFCLEITKNFTLSGGLMKVLSQYGVFLGSLLYLILFFSSLKISRTYNHQKSFALVLVILLASVSYFIFTVPIFTSFWLYGLFAYQEGKKNKQTPSGRALIYTP